MNCLNKKRIKLLIISSIIAIGSLAFADTLSNNKFHNKIENAIANQDNLATDIKELLAKQEKTNPESKDVVEFLETEMDWYEEPAMAGHRRPDSFRAN